MTLGRPSGTVNNKWFPPGPSWGLQLLCAPCLEYLLCAGMGKSLMVGHRMATELEIPILQIAVAFIQVASLQTGFYLVKLCVCSSCVSFSWLIFIQLLKSSSLASSIPKINNTYCFLTSIAKLIKIQLVDLILFKLLWTETGEQTVLCWCTVIGGIWTEPVSHPARRCFIVVIVIYCLD